MRFSDYHVHTTFCDGKDSAEDIVLKAIELGCPEIGFSGHSFTWFDTSYCMSLPVIKEYRDTITNLKEKYRGKIKVVLGVEQDFYSQEDTDEFDFVIGSVHYLLKRGEYIPVDENAQILTDAADKYYGGDIYALVEDYFDTAARVYEKTRCDIIGHFDLITKFNDIGKTKMFDTGHPRYRQAALEALRRIFASIKDLREKKMPAFEVNMGAMAKGYKKEPYPQLFILEEIKRMGGKLILSSDCHDRNKLLYHFDETYAALLDMGFDKGDILSTLK